jgi:transcriptional regulator with XRE-family HTH domain
MDDMRFGSTIRVIRIKRGWRQLDLADRCGLSPSTISRIERGHPGTFSLNAIRAVASALDVRVDLMPRWRAGDLDRLLNAKHSALHEIVAQWLGKQAPDWILAPEVSFAIRGERGVIDIIAWHPGRQALLVIELKTDIADVTELIGTLDRKRRLAREIVADRGWRPRTVSAWVIVAPGRTNRARVAAHRSVLRAAFPIDGRSMPGWLTDPVGSVSALSIWTDRSQSGRPLSSTRRVHRHQLAATPPTRSAARRSCSPLSR